MKKQTALALSSALAIIAVTGCGSITPPAHGQETEPVQTSVSQEPEPMETTASQETQSDKSGEDYFDTDELFFGWLPDNVTRMEAETENNQLLEQTIIDYYEIPEEYWEQTKYYYNYVDLNDDGIQEIFVVVMGSYTGGSGGDSALWCQENEGEMQIYQAFTMVNTPIIITDGEKELIIRRSGGGAETEIVRLTFNNGVYTNVADAEGAENIDNLEGVAIICNNLIKDMESGNYLTLKK